jgi:hypothetical protein
VPLIKSNIPEIYIENEEENDYVELLKVDRVGNLLGMKLTFTQDVINRRKDLDKEINELITLLKHDLRE